MDRLSCIHTVCPAFVAGKAHRSRAAKRFACASNRIHEAQKALSAWHQKDCGFGPHCNCASSGPHCNCLRPSWALLLRCWNTEIHASNNVRYYLNHHLHAISICALSYRKACHGYLPPSASVVRILVGREVTKCSRRLDDVTVVALCVASCFVAVIVACMEPAAMVIGRPPDLRCSERRRNGTLPCTTETTDVL